ncbi:MAG: hypothetical protein M1828_001610 [Chrysothrix sp. TS-e1954]|nr:MAG: hypothetical protein M1828_001610 [Chrysothrix sp. TS-e1954]
MSDPRYTHQTLAGPAERQQPTFDTHFTGSPEPLEGFGDQANQSTSMERLSLSPNFDPTNLDPLQPELNFDSLFANVDPALTSIPGAQFGQRTMDEYSNDMFFGGENINDMVEEQVNGLNNATAVPTQQADYHIQSGTTNPQQIFPDHISLPQAQIGDGSIFADSQYPDPTMYQFGGIANNSYYAQPIPEPTYAQASYQPEALVRMDRRGAAPFPISVYPQGAPFVSSRRGDVARTPTPPETPMSGDFGNADAENLESSRRSRRAKEKTYRAEKPKKDKDKDWVRVNHSTQGTSTRTGKINHFNAKKDGHYQDTTHPNGNSWQSDNGTVFKYNRWGELSRTTFSANELQELIYSNPSNVILWIQKSGADSARRYPTPNSNRCRFVDCPAKHFKRTINVGHFRVAIDEQWNTYGTTRDPFHVAAYVHLYCLERFCDLKHMTEHLDVRADDRVLDSEPLGKFPPALAKNSGELAAAREFVEKGRNKMLTFTHPQYPIHQAYLSGAPKPHELTLTYAMNKAKFNTSSKSKVVQLQNRGMQESNIFVHLGDLARYVRARRRQFNNQAAARGDIPQTDEIEDDMSTVNQEWNQHNLFGNPNPAPLDGFQDGQVAPMAQMLDPYSINTSVDHAALVDASPIEPLPIVRKRQASPPRAAASEAKKKLRLVDYDSESADDDSDVGLFV